MNNSREELVATLFSNGDSYELNESNEGTVWYIKKYKTNGILAKYETLNEPITYVISNSRVIQ